jgi:hypothetical protein
MLHFGRLSSYPQLIGKKSEIQAKNNYNMEHQDAFI